MSNARSNLQGRVVHSLDRLSKDLTRWAVCSAEARYVGERHEVTCKRCLAALAKRDREFQRKARRGLDGSVAHSHLLAVALAAESDHAGPERSAIRRMRGWNGRDAARAIAREEGRAL